MGPDDLDEVIHQPTRLRLMVVLYRHRVLSYAILRNRLGLTDGNLATHARRLEAAGYIRARRVLRGLSFVVEYEITHEGVEAYRAYVAQLERLLRSAEPGASESHRMRKDDAGLDRGP
jgi:DNA-binding MarR family transcriptional regulator